MTFPSNYTCSQTYQDVAPEIYPVAQVVWTLIFVSMLALNSSWLWRAAGGLKGLKDYKKYNSTVKNFWFLEVAFVLYVLYCVIDYQYMRGHIMVCFICQVMFAYFLDSMIVLSAVNWSGMNNIVGRKPVPPSHYKVMRNVALVANFFVQLICCILSVRISTTGDPRISSQDLTWFDGNMSVFRTCGNMAAEFLGVLILLVEGRKLKAQLNSGSGGKGGSNAAAAKILKYIYTASVIVPLLMAFRLLTQVLSRINTTIPTSVPTCTSMGTFMDPTTMMTFLVFCAMLFVCQPGNKKKKSKVGAATTATSTSSSTE
eukprot:CAMPEP_0118649814 /NCGR_PEP_ID=MMETSP0785-20121206/9907_1 /TAXON_ID=91992 /ORGANISM="Bolidomonas pacifica, Strain CCMP 1866" /LENGTH=313 /DNA_ID=CAMNT_0006542133 /DNA_START=108 /DNA_END=1049 /DNA_ORIENTATION=+